MPVYGEGLLTASQKGKQNIICLWNWASEDDALRCTLQGFPPCYRTVTGLTAHAIYNIYVGKHAGYGSHIILFTSSKLISDCGRTKSLQAVSESKQNVFNCDVTARLLGKNSVLARDGHDLK